MELNLFAKSYLKRCGQTDDDFLIHTDQLPGFSFSCPSLYSVVVKKISTVHTCRCRCWCCRSCISCRSCFIVCSSKTPEWLSKQVSKYNRVKAMVRVLQSPEGSSISHEVSSTITYSASVNPNFRECINSLSLLTVEMAAPGSKRDYVHMHF